MNFSDMLVNAVDMVLTMLESMMETPTTVMPTKDAVAASTQTTRKEEDAQHEKDGEHSLVTVEEDDEEEQDTLVCDEDAVAPITNGEIAEVLARSATPSLFTQLLNAVKNALAIAKQRMIQCTIAVVAAVTEWISPPPPETVSTQLYKATANVLAHTKQRAENWASKVVAAATEWAAPPPPLSIMQRARNCVTAVAVATKWATPPPPPTITERLAKASKNALTNTVQCASNCVIAVIVLLVQWALWYAFIWATKHAQLKFVRELDRLMETDDSRTGHLQ